jgi:hypothetical protein
MMEVLQQGIYMVPEVGRDSLNSTGMGYNKL